MTLEIVTFTNGRWRENCYIAAEPGGAALIIDPGGQAEDIAAIIEERGWEPRAIVNTHAHYDHVGAVEPLRLRYGIPFYLHEADEDLLRRVNLYRIFFESKEPVTVPKNSERIPCDSTLRIGPFSIECIGTPGHTLGSVCFIIGSALFSGDTLFRDGVGRTDLPGGNRKLLAAAVARLSTLDPALAVYAGHGGPTVLGEEFAPGRAARRLLDESAD